MIFWDIKYLFKLFHLPYAEMHFKLFGFKGFLFQKLPEIIFDVPERIHFSGSVPVFLLVKDADLFPVRIKYFELIDSSGKSIFIQEIEEDFHTKWNWKVYEIPISIPIDKLFEFYIRFEIKRDNKTLEFVNDTYKIKQKKPFAIFLSSHPYPGVGKAFWGDIHIHSQYTEDQIEFGAPLNYLQKAASYLELDYLFITDHSYDLDQDYFHFGRQLPSENKYKNFVEAIQKNEQHPFLLHGIEVSAGNSQNQNVHLLYLNPGSFQEGYGDSGRKYLNHSPTHPLNKIVKNFSEDELGIAAHPLQKVKKLHQILLNRNQWTEEDLLHEKIVGYQILNGSKDDGFLEGKVRWISHLLKGEKKYIFAGSDSHGNLQLYRQILFPFFSIQYDRAHALGRTRTGIVINKKNCTKSDIIYHLKNGHCFISTGPYINLNVKFHEKIFTMGETITLEGDHLPEILLEGISTPEFGSIEDVQLYGGFLIHQQEKILQSYHFEEPKYKFKDKYIFEKNKALLIPDYIRMELITSKNEIALSNPIWLKK